MRFRELDAIRGIAALIVVFYHCYMWFPFLKGASELVDYTPASRLLMGRLAVLLFFVLSGFILSQPVIRGVALDYGRFVARRIFRIYVPFFVSILLAALLAASFFLPNPSLDYDANYWSRPVDLWLLIQHFAMTGIGSDSVTLNPPMWSLIQEMRISLVFPLLYLMTKRFGWWAFGANFFVSFAAIKAAALLNWMDMALYGETVGGTILITVYYTQFFTLGCLLAIKREELVALFQRLPSWIHFITVSIIILVPYRMLESSFHVAEVYYTATASYILLASIAFVRVQRALNVDAFQWLGRVSYSLYLTHVPVLLALTGWLRGAVPDPLICVTALVASLAVAHLFHWLVERPAEYFGKYLAPSRMAPAE
jgi:peptidoglycan/LPS O-acetylase OafA/YrhL